VIVTCPNCAARYRLSDEVLAKKARLRCAACDHRWIPGATPEPAPPPPKPRGPVTEADEEAAFLAVQEQIRARWHDATTPVVPAAAPPETDESSIFDDFNDTPEDDPEPRQSSKLLRTIVAAIAGTALAIAAAGLWIGRADLSALPFVGSALEGLAPASPVTITITGTTTKLPSGRRVLEVNGTIANRTKAYATVPPLAATLSGPQGTALRWAIPAPVAALPPGQQVAFSSTVTGFPANATLLSVHPTR
jgi:predicted Zn finger-like uncharacterized protein